MVRPAHCHSNSDGPGSGGADRVSSALVNVTATGTANDADEQSLARAMVDVHGAEAAVVARDNARAAALAGQKPQARSWIRVLGLIQQRTNSAGAGANDPSQGPFKE
jgi:hypothetical protein